MSFLNSLNNVFSNKKNFKEWEAKKEDHKAQRQVLLEKNPLSKQELEAAKKRGKVLIDVVDIMDTHSEDVAENVETATTIPESIIPFAAAGLSVLAGYFGLFKPSNAKDKTIREELIKKNEENIKNWKETVNNYNKTEKTYYRKKIYFDPEYHLFNKKAIEDLSKNNELKEAKEGIEKIYTEYLKKTKFLNSKKIAAFFLPIATFLCTFVGATIWGTNLQVQSSRIARWQSRKDLNNPKYFVQYTDEQIAQAEKNLDSKKENEVKKGMFTKFFNKDKVSILDVIRDNKNYKEWKKQDSDKSKKITRNLSAEELDKAKRDQEVIQRVTKEINNKAEEYSENMEVAADVFLLGTGPLGAAIGSLATAIVNKLGLGDKISKKGINSLIKSLDEKDAKMVQKSYEEFLKLKPKDTNYKKAHSKFSNNLIFAKYKKEANNNLEKISQIIKKFIGISGTTAWGRTKVVAGITMLPSTIVGLLVSLKLQKSSARAGRFIAKRELEQNPENFVGFTQEEHEKVGNIKAEKKSFGKNFIEYITFLPRVLKEYFEYQNFKNTKGAKQKELLDELVKLEVSEKQLKEGKDYQRKVFNTFEKVDEGSQEYSESMEAATTIAKPIVMGLGITTLISPLEITMIQIAKGKISAFKIVDKMSNFLANKTKFLKGKITSKYMDDIKDNITKQIQNTNVGQNILCYKFKCSDITEQIKKDATVKSFMQDIIEEIKTENMFAFDPKVIEKFPENKNIDIALYRLKNDFHLLQDANIYDIIKNNKIKETILASEKTYAGLKRLGIDVNSIPNEGFNEKLVEKINIASFQKTKIKNFYFNYNFSNNLLQKEFRAIFNEAKKHANTPEEFYKALAKISEKYKNIKVKDIAINQDMLSSLLSHYGENITNGIKIDFNFMKEKLNKVINEVISIIETSNDGSWKKNIQKLADIKILKRIFDTLDLENQNSKELVKVLKNFKTILENIPSEKAEEILFTLKKNLKENPLEYNAFFEQKGIWDLLKTESLKNAGKVAVGSWVGTNLVTTFALESYLANLQKQAGRLGVMKGLEKLEDPTYYADIEPS